MSTNAAFLSAFFSAFEDMLAVYPSDQAQKITMNIVDMVFVELEQGVDLTNSIGRTVLTDIATRANDPDYKYKSLTVLQSLAGPAE